jgi:hypothetical protein
MSKTLADRYPYIVRYCRRTGSYQHWIDGQLEKAAQGGAPERAYMTDSKTGEWLTVDSIMVDRLRLDLGLEPFVVTAQNIGEVAAWAGEGVITSSSESATTLSFASIWAAKPFLEYVAKRGLPVALHTPLKALDDPALITVTWKD